MQKLKVIGSVVTVILIIIIVFGFAVNFILGSAEMPDPVIQVIVEKGQVWHRGQGDIDFQEVDSQIQAVAGDIVKTGDNSVARISFFGTQELMMDEDSEVIITAGMIDQNSPLLTQVKVKLIKGQVWARLMELLHPQAAFEVEAGNVVATVRGTSFNVALTDTYVEVFVYENEVAIYEKSSEAFLAALQTGQIFRYDLLNKKFEINSANVLDLKTSQRENPWILNNMMMNREFKNFVEFNRQLILKKIKVLPDSKWFRLKLFGERLRGFIALDKDSYQQKLNAKRAIEAQAMFDAGKIDQAIAHLREFGINKENCPTFARLQSFDANFTDKLARNEQVREFFFSEMLNVAEKDFVGARTQNINSKIQLPVESDTLKIEEPEIKVNIEAPSKPAEPATVLPTVETEQPKAPESAPVVKEPVENQTAPAEPAKPVSLKISADKVNLSSGGQAVLDALLEYSDKTSSNVTADTVLSLGPDDLTGEYAGSLNGNIFSASDRGGKAYIKGTYRTLDGQSFSDNLTITVLIMVN